ncbi:hypothetical protein D9M68_404040 [compost metagenome]
MLALQRDEGARRLAPALVRARHHRRFEHRRMAVQHALDLDGGDVLAAGDDDVLQPVADFHVAVRMPHRQVAGVEPAAGEGFLGGAGVLQVALHHRVATHEDLADGLAVARHRFEAGRVGDHHAFQGRVAHALARLDARALVQRLLVPLAFPGTHRDRAVDLGETVDVGDPDAHLLHRADHLGRRRGAGDQRVDRMVDGGLGRGRHVDQRVEHDRRAAEVGDPVLADQVEDLLRIDPAQADMYAGHGGYGPGVAPAVAVEHRQGPQVHRVLAHGPDHLVAQRVQVGAAVVVDHALGIAGGAGGVVQRDGVPLVLRPLPGELGIALGEQRLVVQAADQLALAVFRIVHVDHQRRMVEHADGGADDVVELAVGDQHLGLAVLQHEGDGLRVQAHVEGVEHRADHRHAEVRLDHLGNVRQHHRHRVATADAASGQRGSQAAAALVGLAPVAADAAVDHGGVVGIDAGGALDEAQRSQRGMVHGRRSEALFEDRHGDTLGLIFSIVLCSAGG